MQWIIEQPLWLWIVALVGGWAVLVLGRLALRAWRSSQWRRRSPIGLKNPVVLVHGIFGFDKIGTLGLQQEYFRGIARYLELLGVEAYAPRLALADSTPNRAKQLADYIRGLERGRVCIVAHSMGGLDARYAIEHYGIADLVACVVTIGTPHKGTPLAAIGGHRYFRQPRRFLARLGLSTLAIDGLREAAMQRFNQEVRDHPDVAYLSVVATASWMSILFNPALWLSYLYLRRQAGANDGIVPAASQSWGQVLSEVDADHWALIGWSWRFDARALYEGVLRDVVRVLAS